MKKIVVLLLAFVGMFAGCSQLPEGSTEYHQQPNDNLVIINNLSKEQAGLILSNTREYDKLLLNIENAALISTDQNNQCIRSYQTKSYINCLSHLRSVNQESAKIEVMTAKYLAQKGEREKAKEIYRKIIKAYIGNAYKPYVQQAKSGLEDLKGK